MAGVRCDGYLDLAKTEGGSQRDCTRCLGKSRSRICARVRFNWDPNILLKLACFQIFRLPSSMA